MTKKKVKEKAKAMDPPKEDVTNLEIKDVQGIGPTYAKKLRDAGLLTVLDLAVARVEDLALDADISKDVATTFIMSALTLLREAKFIEQEFTTADVILEDRKALRRCTTGANKLDELFQGGIESQAVTEFYGEFGSGKSQICHTMCVMAEQPVSEKGLDGGVIYIDTERTFRPERVQEIAGSRGLDPEGVLKKIGVCRVYKSAHLELIVKNIGKYIDQFQAKLLIIDSLVSLHRSDFTGRGTLSDRQQRLNSIMHKLLRVAAMYNIVIVVTNQVLSSPDMTFGNPTKPVGGHVIGHSTTYRVYLRKSGRNRIAQMVDSPHHPSQETLFTINNKGIEDAQK